MNFVLDASAVVALLRHEPGGERVRAVLDDAIISAVNLQEVFKELMEEDIAVPVARLMVDSLKLNVRNHGVEDALLAAAMHNDTGRFGRGLGDRSCLSLALREKATALTADREWARINVEGLKIELIR